MIDDALARAVALELPGLVVEFELLPKLTEEPAWGAEIIVDPPRRARPLPRDVDGLRSALRVTPNDIREFVRPPLMRAGEKWERMVESFERCAAAGADLLAIESTGGKELHDDALIAADLPAAVLALGVLAPRDMAFLWDQIVDDRGDRTASPPPATPRADSATPRWCSPRCATSRGCGPRVIRVMSVAAQPRRATSAAPSGRARTAPTRART